MDNTSQVLLNPIRMRIVQHLATSESVTAGELVALMPGSVGQWKRYTH